MCKYFTCKAGDTGDVGLIPGSGKSPEGHGNPLQYSCLENPMDRGAWQLQSIGSQRVGHDWATNTHHQEKPSTWGWWLTTTIGRNMLFKLKSWHTIGSLHPWLNLSFRNCRKWLIMCISDLKDKTPHRPLLHYLRNYFNLVYTFARRSNQSILKEISPGCSLEALMLKLKLPILWPPDAKNWLTGKDPDAGKDWRRDYRFA